MIDRSVGRKLTFWNGHLQSLNKLNGENQIQRTQFVTLRKYEEYVLKNRKKL